jgi:hypothetical protein
MMEALLSRDFELKEDSKIDVQKLSEDARRAEKEHIRSSSGTWGQVAFQAFLEEAVQFCNGSSPGASDLKTHVRDM